MLPWALQTVKKEPDTDEIITETLENDSAKNEMSNMPVFSFKKKPDNSEYCRLIKRRPEVSSITMIMVGALLN